MLGALGKMALECSSGGPFPGWWSGANNEWALCLHYEFRLLSPHA